MIFGILYKKPLTALSKYRELKRMENSLVDKDYYISSDGQWAVERYTRTRPRKEVNRTLLQLIMSRPFTDAKMEDINELKKFVTASLNRPLMKEQFFYITETRNEIVVEGYMLFRIKYLDGDNVRMTMVYARKKTPLADAAQPEDAAPEEDKPAETAPVYADVNAPERTTQVQLGSLTGRF